MALILANRVQESATANTTVSFTLTGAIQGFQSFSAIGNGNTTYYSATDGSGNWEVGLGTYSTTGPTLTRTTIYASSNSGLAVTFSGTVNVFVTYPSGRSVNLDASGNVSALGTVSSGVWQGSTVGVAYGGTGVTASSGANSVMLRDANQNVAVNRLNQANTNTTAAGGTTALTAASSYIHTLVGTGGQTYTMPDATTLTTGVAFVFNNMATGTLTLQDFAAGAIGTIPAGGAGAVFLTANPTVGGTWDIHSYLPEGVTFGTNAFDLGTSVISGGTWQGGTIQPGYGGTGLTTFTGANNALYSTGATTLTAGTLPVAAGGTGNTSGQAASVANSVTFNNGGAGGASGSTFNGSGALTVSYNTIGAPSTTGTNATGTWAINISGNAATATSATSATTASNVAASADQAIVNQNNGNAVQWYGRILSKNSTSDKAAFLGTYSSIAGVFAHNNALNAWADLYVNTVDGSGGGTVRMPSTVLVNGNQVLHAGNYNSYAPTLTGGGASGTWGINISGNAATATSTPKVSTYDLRSTALTPSYFGQGLSTAFMANSTDGLNDGGTYHGIIQFQQWSDSSGGGAAEIAITDNNNVWHRGSSGGLTTWSTWYKFLDSGNYNSYAPTLTGTGASGTWGISISGNAATATNVAGGAANRIPYNTAAATTAFIAAPTTSSTFLQWNGSAFTWAAASTSPAGSNTQIQFNNSGAFGASANLTFASNTLTVNSVSVGRGGGSVSTNTAVGGSALGSNTTGVQNTAFGNLAANAITTQTDVTAIGYNATVGSAATSVGSIAFSAEQSVAVGVLATASNTSTVAVGYSSTASGTNAVAVGFVADVQGAGGVGIGVDATVANPATGGIAIGSSAVSGASETIAIGNLTQSSTSGREIRIGARQDFTTGAGTGSGNILIGYQTNTFTGNPSNSIAIGDSITVMQSNATYMNKFRINPTTGLVGPAYGLTYDSTTHEVYAVTSGPPPAPAWLEYTDYSSTSPATVDLPTGWSTSYSGPIDIICVCGMPGGPWGAPIPGPWTYQGANPYMGDVYTVPSFNWSVLASPTNVNVSSPPANGFAVSFIRGVQDDGVNGYFNLTGLLGNYQFSTNGPFYSGFPLVGSSPRYGHAVVFLNGNYATTATAPSGGTIVDKFYDSFMNVTVLFIDYTEAALNNIQAGAIPLFNLPSSTGATSMFWYNFT